jgi:hypothetical protein
MRDPEAVEGRTDARLGRYALGTALIGDVVFLGSWLFLVPWHGTERETAAGALIMLGLWGAAELTALGLGVAGWERSNSAKGAVGAVLGLVVLILAVLATATWQ